MLHKINQTLRCLPALRCFWVPSHLGPNSSLVMVWIETPHSHSALCRDGDEFAEGDLGPLLNELS
jgi:hypothetical protein